MESEQLEKRFSELERQNRQLCLGVNGFIALACVLLGIWNLYQTLLIGKFCEIFDQMLNGKELPTLSNFVLGHPTSLFYLALALPLAAIAIVVTRGRKISTLFVLLPIALLITLQLTITRIAIWGPLQNIISEMSSI